MILDEWLADLPEQFRNKSNIEILLATLSKQLEEIASVFEELNTQTTLDKALGKPLDGIGSIISLSRKEASAFLRKTDESRLNDETYRKALKFGSLRNTCSCTYEDIMDAIHMLWETDTVSYEEPTDRPATILLNISDVSIDGPDVADNRTLAIKPAGVTLEYTYALEARVNNSGFDRVEVPKLSLRTKSKRIAENEVIRLSMPTRFKAPMQSMRAFYIEGYNSAPMDGTYKMDGKQKLNSRYYKEEL